MKRILKLLRKTRHPVNREYITLPVAQHDRQKVDQKYRLSVGTRGYTALDRDFGCDWGEE